MRWRPAVDLKRVITTTEMVVGAVVIANRAFGRPSGAKANVTMGPGGWVSLKGGALEARPAKRVWRRLLLAATTSPTARRPVWARLLAAKTLQSLIS